MSQRGATGYRHSHLAEVVLHVDVMINTAYVHYTFKRLPAVCSPTRQPQ